MVLKKVLIVIISFMIMSSKTNCKISTPKTDESTLSNYNEIIPEHTNLEFEVDFNKKK